VEVYGQKVRDGMPLAEAVATFTAYDARQGKPDRAAEWEMRLAQAARAPTSSPTPSLRPEQQQKQMAQRMRMER
jgi:hypothetical protein